VVTWGRMVTRNLLIAPLALWPIALSGQSLGTFGTTGLIDMPSAEMAPDGTVSVSYTSAANAKGASLSFQLAPRISASYRFHSIDAFGAGAQSIDGSQLDLTFALLTETKTRPGLAVGIRDLAGTAAYSSEFIVATKSFANGLSVTGGLGWGRLAARPVADNPFGGSRPNAAGSGDRLNIANAFGGDDVGAFGGIAYEFGDGWRLKAEYSSDDYAQERAAGDLRIDGPLNFGIEKSWDAGVQAGLYSIGGNEIGFRLSFVANPRKPAAPQDFIPGPAPFSARPANANRATSWAADEALKTKIVASLAEVLVAEGIVIEAAELSSDQAELQIRNTKMNRQAKAIGRTARLMALGMPASVEQFRVTLIEGELAASTAVIERADMEALVDTHEAVPESWRRLVVENGQLLGTADYRHSAPSALSYSITPALPFGFYGDGLAFDPQISAQARYQIAPGLSLSGQMTQSIIGGLGGTAPAAGTLPQVRSNAISYGQNTPVLQNLTADYVTQLSDRLYGRVSAGYLERMFGGVSGEVLWRDAASPLAYGLEMNYAAQRDPDSFAGFTDYDTISGHGSVYWDTGWNGVTAQLDFGRYLAGDWGSTLTVARRFDNGWEVAGFATATDADLGASDASTLDKGVRLTIPLQWSLPFATRRKTTVAFQDFTRDDGARLDLRNRLYPTLRVGDKAALAANWEAFWQ